MKKMSRFDRYLITHPRFANAFVACYNRILPAKLRQWIADHREPLEEITYKPVPEPAPVQHSRGIIPPVKKFNRQEPTWYAEAKQKGGAKRIAAAESKRRRKAVSHSRTHPNG